MRKILLLCFCYLVLIAIYALFAWNDKTLVPGFIAILTGMITTLGAIHVSNNSASRGQSIAPPVAATTSAPLPNSPTSQE